MKSVKWICDLCHKEQDSCSRVTVFGPPADNPEAPVTAPIQRRSTDRPLKAVLELDVCHTCLPLSLQEVLTRVRWKEKRWVKIEIIERIS